MGFIVKQSVRRAKESSASPLVVPVAPYLTDDHVAVFLAIQGSSSAITTPAGWTAVGTLSRTGSTAGQWFAKKMTADSSAESTQSFTFSGSGTGVSATSQVLRGVDTSWLAGIASGVDYFTTGTSASVTFASAAGAASGYANALMLVGGVFNSDSIARCYMDALTSISLERNPNTAHFVGYKQMPAASYGSPALTAYRSASGNSQMSVLMVKTATGAALQPNCLTQITEAQWYGSFGVNNSAMNPTWSMPDAATIDGLATYTSGTPTISATHPSTITNPDTLLPWNNVTSINISAASVGASDLWVGHKHAFTTNLSGNKAVSLSWRVPYSDTVAHIGSKGVIVKFSSSSSDWVAYQLDAKADFVSNAFKNVVIQPGISTVFASAGTYAPGSQAEVTYLWHRLAGVTTAANIDFMCLNVFDPAAPAQITGGGEAYPATPYALAEALKAWNSFRLGWLQSSVQVMTYGAVQIGDGSKATYWDSSAWSLGFPQKYNAAIQNVWRVAENTMSISLKPSSADTMLLTAGSYVSDGAQAFVVDAGGSVPASYSFAGQSFVGLTVTDNLGLLWPNVTIKGGGKMTLAAGGDMTDSAIRDTTATDAALSISANGTVLTRAIIDGTGALYALELGTSVTAVTLTDCDITAGSTDKVHVLKTTGTVTITISGTTTLASGDVTSEGATVDIAAPELYQKVTVSGITTGARVQIYDTTSATELFNGTASAGDTVVSGSTVVWTDPTAAAADRAIRVRVSYVSGATAKNFIETSGLTCGQTSGTAEITYPVTPTDDTVYNANGENGATIYGGGEITFVDASPDRIEMAMVANTLSLKEQYAAWVYYVFTSAGIATDIDYINAIDTANYEFTGIRWKNVSSPTAPLEITGGYAWDSVTLSPMTLIDTSGGTLFLAPAHVVAYQTTGTYAITGDLQDALDAIAGVPADVLSAAQTTPIHSDVRKVNSYTVDGNGQTGTEWGPA